MMMRYAFQTTQTPASAWHYKKNDFLLHSASCTKQCTPKSENYRTQVRKIHKQHTLLSSPNTSCNSFLTQKREIQNQFAHCPQPCTDVKTLTRRRRRRRRRNNLLWRDFHN
jgi:hypothetical protein